MKVFVQAGLNKLGGRVRQKWLLRKHLILCLAVFTVVGDVVINFD
jgi:hypothetical protein